MGWIPLGFLTLAFACGTTSSPPDSSVRDAGGDAAVGRPDSGAMDGGGTALPFCATRSVPRACGLQRVGMVRMCMPGSIVGVGCHQGCTPPLGSCEGDAVIQICPGMFQDMPCDVGTAIVSNDDQSGSVGSATCSPSAADGSEFCPAIQFTCPPSGRYTVWVGSSDSTHLATSCVVAVQ